MINVRDLRIDSASLGPKMLLVAVAPAYEYKDGKRTDTVAGYRYDVALPAHAMDKLSVRIPGPQQMEAPEEAVLVEFDGLEIGLYERDGRANLTAKAAGIRAAGKKPQA